MRWCLLWIGVIVAASLAGCSSSPETTPPTTSGPTAAASSGPRASGAPASTTGAADSSSPPGTEAPSSAAPGNHPPVPALVAILNGTLAKLRLAATDADGDALTWTLAYGDGAKADGKVLPMNVTHTYAAGSFNVTLRVSDGKATANVTQKVTIAVAAKRAIVFSGHIVAPDPYAVQFKGCFLEIFGPDTQEDVAGHQFRPDESVDGWSYSFDHADMLAQFWDDSPAILGQGTAGAVPDGTTLIYTCGTGPASVDADFTLTLGEA